MHSVMRVTVAATVLGIASLSLAASAHAGNGSAVGAGLLGFGVGAIVGNALAPQTIYVAPPPPVYYAPPPPLYIAPAPVYVGPVYYERHPYRDIAANKLDGCVAHKFAANHLLLGVVVVANAAKRHWLRHLLA